MWVDGFFGLGSRVSIASGNAVVNNVAVLKGIKRKADAMNPMIGNSNLDAFSPGLGEKMGKISSRRESGRQIKKVNKDLPDSQVNIRVILLIYI
ncbi:hypothetical protein E2C01_061224 [Portunus trituberculatus]|uniref:Uncharacterized protein n=1 Tax=Portunus trituberculatus TaxID=210409 RepID=A0A5B7H4M3_PORTR|nr:hypothetical protein [Portunus trituberculatus]